MQGGPTRRNIVKCKVVLLSILVVIAALALSAAGAQAGSGGSPSPLAGFFVCHEINQTGPSQDLDVESPVFGADAQGLPILQKIKLGKAALACAFARVFSRPAPVDPQTGDPVPIEPLDPPDRTGPETMKCYAVSNSQNNKVQPPAQYNVTDALAGEVNVPIPPTKLQFLCAPADFFLQQ